MRIEFSGALYIDPKGITTQYHYDAANRLTLADITNGGENGADSDTHDIRYTYDHCTYGKGRLCSTTEGQGSGLALLQVRGQVSHCCI